MSSVEFNRLLTGNMDYLRQFALGFTKNMDDAEDLLQETMLKALRYRNNFAEGTNIKGWLFTIMRNIFINDYKRKKFQNTITDSTDNQYYLNQNTKYSADSVTWHISEKDINRAIDNLTDTFKVPFTMFLEGFHYDEIADHLTIPMGTVKSRIFHARKKLQEDLVDYRR